MARLKFTRSHERGSLLPALAVVTFVVLLIVFALGVDTVIVKIIASRARSQLDLI